MKSRIVLSLSAVGLATSGTSFGEVEWDSKGELAVEGRAFSADGQERTEDLGLGLFGRLEVGLEHEPFRERVRGFGRLDRMDPGRTVFVFEEAWFETRVGDFRLRVGPDIVNWSATEAFHPADVLNSRNLDGDLESFEKIGEPMVQLSQRFASTTIQAFFMPFYVDPVDASAASRLSFVPPILALGPVLKLETDGSLAEDDVGLQGALRVTQSLGIADLGIHVVHHMDRHEPEVVFDQSATPHLLYRKATLVGGTAQLVLDALIVKLEASHRFFASPERGLPYFGLSDRDHTELAVGLEYGVSHESGIESTFLLEGQAFVGLDEEDRRRIHVFQRDVLLGWRIALQDEDSTELRATAILDTEEAGEMLLGLAYRQRLGESWGLEVGGRLFLADRPADPRGISGLMLLRDADHVRATLTRYF